MPNVAPIKFLKTDPENGHISKAEFVKKRKKREELEARMKAYESKAIKDIEQEMEEEERAMKPQPEKSEKEDVQEKKK